MRLFCTNFQTPCKFMMYNQFISNSSTQTKNHGMVAATRQRGPVWSSLRRIRIRNKESGRASNLDVGHLRRWNLQLKTFRPLLLYYFLHLANLTFHSKFTLYFLWQSFHYLFFHFLEKLFLKKNVIKKYLSKCFCVSFFYSRWAIHNSIIIIGSVYISRKGLLVR